MSCGIRFSCCALFTIIAIGGSTVAADVNVLEGNAATSASISVVNIVGNSLANDDADTLTFNGDALGNLNERIRSRPIIDGNTAVQVTVDVGATSTGSSEVNGFVTAYIDVDSRQTFSQSYMASSEVTFRFEVTGGPATLTRDTRANGTVVGGAAISTTITLRSGAAKELFQVTFVGDENTPISPPGEIVATSIPQGTYSITVLSTSTLPIETSLDPDLVSDVFVRGTFNFNIKQEETRDFRFWSANDGEFDYPENWDPPGALREEQTVVFDLPADYAVSIPPTSTERALIERGNVRFNGNPVGSPYNITGAIISAPSLVVGNSNSDKATLTVSNMQLISVNATIGLGANTEGVVSTSISSAWRIDNLLVVGGAGKGTLEVSLDFSPVAAGATRIGDASGSDGTVDVKGTGSDPNVLLNTGPLSVGLCGKGTLDIKGGIVQSGATMVGDLPGSVGTVNVTDDVGNANWVVGGALTVGNQGHGTLRIEAGRVDVDFPGDVQVGNTSESTGNVLVDGSNSALATLSDMNVGTLDGFGTLIVAHGGVVSAANMFIGPLVDTDQGDGTVIVQKLSTIDPEAEPIASSIDLSEDLLVGGAGIGALSIFGSTVTAASASFGIFTGGDARVNISDSGTLEASGDINIGEDSLNVVDSGKATVTLLASAVLAGDRVFLREGSRITGSFGIARARNGFFNEGGELGILNVADFGPLENKQSDPIGPLTIDADLVMTGGVIKIGVHGLGAGDFGILEITGDADITDATIRMVFLDGFLPRTGDMFPFLMVAGALTMTAPSLEFEGVADGFDYQVNEVNGMLMFEALNNAQALPQSVGCSAGSESGTSTTMVPSLLAGIALMMFRKKQSAT